MNLKNLFKSKTNQPVKVDAPAIPDTLAELLTQDDVSILVERFCRLDQADCRQLVMIWVDNSGQVKLRSNMDELSYFGLLGMAMRAEVANGDDNEE